MSKSIRRHHDERIKRKVFKHIMIPDNIEDIRMWVGKRSTARQICSCSLCGNPRKHNKGSKKNSLSYQELKHREDINNYE